MTPQDLLRLHPFFAELSEQDGEALLKRTRTRRVPAGHILFQEGDAGDGLYGILAGRVAFTVDSVQGKGLILNVLGPGEFFGEIALLDGGPRSATVTARTDMRLLGLTEWVFRGLIQEHPTIAVRTLESMAGRLRAATQAATA